MMRHWVWSVLVGTILVVSSGSVRAQTLPGAPLSLYGANSIYGAPGYFGMAYGLPSYGFPRTYSVFSSPYGAGYGAGYSPYGYVPNRYGVGLWRPGLVSPGYIFGAASYRTIPVPYRAVPAASPFVGYYAPGFGPPSFTVW
jgi:hypothetical protein